MDRHHLDLPLVTAVAQQMVKGHSSTRDKDMSATFLTSVATASQASFLTGPQARPRGWNLT
jgi:hypothetical protein